MAKLLKNLTRKAKAVAIVGVTAAAMAGAGIGYCQYIAKPEIYIEYKHENEEMAKILKKMHAESQIETVTIENKLFYTTQYGHKKVLLFMGGLYEREQVEGLNFRLPFETAYDVDVDIIAKLEKGYRTKKAAEETDYVIPKLMSKGGDFETQKELDVFIKMMDAESIMVTGDEGELRVLYAVQFVKKDPNAFLFNVREPINTVDEVTESALREVIARYTYDEALTTGKKKIRKEATALAQKILDEYKIGIELMGILPQQILAPTFAVEEAFDKINIAKQEARRLIEEGGKEYQKDTKEAVGKKQQMIESAKGTAQEKINAAQGKVARYMEVHKGYKQAPKANRFRLHQEAVRRLMEKSKVIIVDPKAGGGFLQHMMLDKGEGGKK